MQTDRAGQSASNLHVCPKEMFVSLGLPASWNSSAARGTISLFSFLMMSRGVFAGDKDGIPSDEFIAFHPRFPDRGQLWRALRPSHREGFRLPHFHAAYPKGYW